MKQTISAIILTKNEEKNIPKCLQSVSWCDEIIVIDDFSEDKTINKIKKLKLKIKNYNSKLKIYQRGLKEDFATQRNFGLEKSSCNWVLFIDADEIVSESLKQEITKTLQNQAIAEICKGYLISRQDYFLGRRLNHGETGNIKLLRLAQKDAGKWNGYVHETWKITGKTGELKNTLLHRPHQAITSFLTKINLYTDILAKKWQEEGIKVHFWSIILYPTGKFIQNYIICLGFLDGIPGLIMAMIMSFHSFLVRGKLWLLF